MKGLFFELIWQWRGGSWIRFNLTGIELEYDKFEPSITFEVILIGIGFRIVWICPWETEESLYAKDCAKNCWQILSLGKE